MKNEDIMETLVSGLDESACRAALGIESLQESPVRWCDPADLASKAADQIVWLYRAPWSAAVDTDTQGASRERMPQWLATNREMLNKRAKLTGKLLLVNVDRVAPETLRAKVIGSSAEHAKPAALTPSPQSQALSRLFDIAAPDYWDVFEALEAAAWNPAAEPLFRTLDALHADILFALLDSLQQGKNSQRVAVELQRQVDAGIATSGKLRQENDELRQEGELLLLQLHQVQEELEQYYLKTVEQDKTVGRLTQSLKDAQASNKALQSQLRQMQDELKRLQNANIELTQPEQEAPPPSPDAHNVNGASRRWMPPAAGDLLSRAKQRKLRQAQLAAIRKSEWFDRQWYLQTYPDVRDANVDPAAHFVESGWRENRNPCPRFDTAFYLRTNPDIREAGINPLWHFIEFGHKEGRRPRKP